MEMEFCQWKGDRGQLNRKEYGVQGGSILDREELD